MPDQPRDRSTGRVLELRIHGVNNTSPAGMLDLLESDIEQVLGDELAGFWRAEPAALAKLRPGERGYTPCYATREAYSWGGLARTGPAAGGTGARGAVVGGLARVGWALLLPFGLANVAYWTRRLGTQEAPPPRGEGRHAPPGTGAATIRLFGLALTALFVVTICDLSLDLVASQCFRADSPRCSALPSIFNVLSNRTQPVRLAMASVFPVLGLLGLAVLSAVSRARYERAEVDRGALMQPDGEPRWPILATPGFWSGDRLVGGQARMHLAAGFGIVALSLSWPALMGAGPACATPRALTSTTCGSQLSARPAQSWTFGVLALAAGAVIGWSAAAAWGRAGDAPDLPTRPLPVVARRSAWLVAAACAVLAGAEIALATTAPVLSSDISLPGVRAFPTALGVVLFSLACGALTMRLDRFAPLWAVLIAGSILAIAWWDPAVVVVIAVLIALGLRLLMAQRGDSGARWIAWRNMGPGVVLGASLLLALTLSSLMVLGIGDWLNGGHGAASLVSARQAAVTPLPDLRDQCNNTCPAPDPLLLAPVTYVYFGGATFVSVGLLLLVFGAVLTRTWRGTIAALLEDPDVPAGAPLARRLQRARRFAASAHRAEPLLALLVLFGMLSAAFVLVVGAGGWVVSPTDSTWPAGVARTVTNAGTAVLALVALVLLGALVGGAPTGRKRPLGLVWDLICFLPRAAHPFGPPCYAERAVPELASRVDWWLATDASGAEEGAEEGAVSAGRRRGDTVVLSAHSLGAVLAVAVLLGRDPPVPGQRVPVRLLSYGVQLRAYFGRVFPELLGADALGTPPSRSAALWSVDPWDADRNATDRPVPAPGDSVLGRLSQDRRRLWRNLWRRTDYLGFPVETFGGPLTGAPLGLDVPAQEVDRTGYLVDVGTHSNYFRTPAYIEQLDALSSDDQ